MKKIALLIALAVASLNPALAQSQAENPLRFFVGVGMTSGGDKVSAVAVNGKAPQSIRAGGVFALVAGADYRFNPYFSGQLSLGYHWDDADSAGDDLRLKRLPVEVLGYYHVSPEWRIGGGARVLAGTKFTGNTSFGNADVGFDTKLGGVLEAEYQSGGNWGVKVRYVAEKLNAKEGDVPAGVERNYDANHVGVFANYYF